MKEIKPHEERYFKDIVLRSILKEISNEQGAKPLDDLIPSKEQKGIKRRIVRFAVASLSILLLAAFFIPDGSRVVEPAQKTAPAEQVALLHNDKQSETKDIQKEEEKERTPIREERPSKLLIEKKENSLIIVSQDATQSATEPIQESRHDRAKAQLLEQMKK